MNCRFQHFHVSKKNITNQKKKKEKKKKKKIKVGQNYKVHVCGVNE